MNEDQKKVIELKSTCDGLLRAHDQLEGRINGLARDLSFANLALGLSNEHGRRWKRVTWFFIATTLIFGWLTFSACIHNNEAGLPQQVGR